MFAQEISPASQSIPKRKTKALQSPSSRFQMVKDVWGKRALFDEGQEYLVILGEKLYGRTSPVVQWLRIHLPMQGTWVRALVWEDPTCHRATKPVHNNYWACALEPVNHNYWAHVPQLLKPVPLEPVLRNKRSHCNEKPAHRNEDPMQPKINK